MNDFPKGWVSTNLDNIIIHEKGKKPKNLSSIITKKFNIPYLTIDAIESDIISNYTDGNGCVLSTPQDVLIVWDGSRCGLVFEGEEGAVCSTMQKLQIPVCPTKYLFYFLRDKYLLLNSKPKGTGTPHVNPDILYFFVFPLSPLPEQHRIVAKIEELFTRLDAGVEELKKIKELIKRYRQSVLKNAFKGKLTEEWREKRKDKLEPASVLLEKIKKEREKKAKSEFKEQKSLDNSELYELPENWICTRLDSLFEFSNGKGLTKEQMKEGDYYVYGGNGITGTNNEWLCEDESIVIGRVGAQCGNIHLALPKSWISDNAIYTSWKSKDIFLKFFYYLLLSCELNKFSGGSGQPYITQTILNSHFVPLPPNLEQSRIVEEIERRFSLSDEIEKIVDHSLNQSKGLHQSVLKKAFEGKLVQQDPTDEPAEKLLERIKSEKAKKEEGLRSGKRTKNRNEKNEKSKYKKGRFFENG